MKPYMWALAAGAYAALLLLVGFGGNLLALVAISVLLVVTAGLSVIVGVGLGSSTEAARWRLPTTRAALSMEAARKELRTVREELAGLRARNEMLSGLVAKDPALLAELDDFHAWRTGDFTADEDQAIANVTRERS